MKRKPQALKSNLDGRRVEEIWQVWAETLVGWFKRQCAVQRSLSEVERTPEGIRSLFDMACDTQQELPAAVTEWCENLIEHLRSHGLSGVLDAVESRLVMHHTHAHPDETEQQIADRVRPQLDGFLKLLARLEEKGVGPFTVAVKLLLEPELVCAWTWKGWSLRQQAIGGQMTAMKKKLTAKRNLIAGSSELLATDRERLSEYYGGILECMALIEEGPKRVHSHYSPRGGHPRKSPVWTPFLKELRDFLKPHFQPKRHWETRGGRPLKRGTEADPTPQEVYEVMNEILHYFYPSVWEIDPNTTAIIKSRCST